MKPSSTKKTCKGENISTPNINKYFKSIPKPTENKKECETTRAFYINALKRKLQKCDVFVTGRDVIEGEVGGCTVELEEEVGACAVVLEQDVVTVATNNGDQNQILQMSTECNNCNLLEANYKDLKKAYAKLSIHHPKQDLKYYELLKTRTRTNHLGISDVATSSGDIFLPNEIKHLQCMPLDKKKDSSFILQALEYAYKNNLSVLCNKTLKGKPELINISEEGEVQYLPKKDLLTPKNVERIRELFIDRIAKCRIDPVEYGERIKESNINKLIASSITNIIKRQK